MMLSTSIVWDRRGMMINRTVNGGNPNPTGCGGGLNWVAEGCNPNPKSGTYLTLLRGVACQQFKISYNTMSAVNSARVAGTALL